MSVLELIFKVSAKWEFHGNILHICRQNTEGELWGEEEEEEEAKRIHKPLGKALNLTISSVNVPWMNTG